MTYLQLINSVLRRLREDEVATYNSSAYSKLIGDFINETKREVEDAWDWVQLRDTIQVTTADGDYSYTLTGAGNRFKVLQVINDTENHELEIASYAWMNKQFTMIGDGAAEGSPFYYDINGNTSGDPNVNLFPIPNAIEVINFNLVLPQDDLAADVTELTVPSWPVVLGAHAKALSERGEDGSTMYAEVMNNYDKALSDAIAIDAGKVPHELIWEVK